jgi:RNA ligase (TIGR02306 family)
MRKMATIRKISSISPIENADAIECATVGGWKVVVKKGDFKVGDLAVYCEIDSWIPNSIAPFLSKGREPREYNEVTGERLRTMKLRGQLSQGLLLPVVPTGDQYCLVKSVDGGYSEAMEGDDVSDILGVQKWEMEIPTQLAGLIKGNFPTIIPKTDQERVQNIVNEIVQANGKVFEVTEKLEGSSMTCYLLDGEFGVCSRNLDMKRDEKNSLWVTAIRENIEEKIKSTGKNNLAIQGELVGPGIQGNIYKFSRLEFFIFDIYDADKGRYLTPIERQDLVSQMGLKHVPIVEENFELNCDVESLINKADGNSLVGNKGKTLREGLVFKEVNGEMSFKAISNKYLLGQSN